MIALTLYLIYAALCAIVLDAVVPGVVPRVFHSAVLVCIVSCILVTVGGWLGSLLVGDVGPQWAGVSLIPTLIGSGLLVFGFTSVSKTCESDFI